MMNLIYYPNDILTTPTEEVTEFNESLYKELQTMNKIRHKEGGIGLAANQVGLSKRMFVMGPMDRFFVRFIVNPKVIDQEGKIYFKEGCLSFPDITVKVPRALKIKVEYSTVIQDQKSGEYFKDDATEEMEGVRAICFQHEMDHLDGKTFLDYVGDMKRKMIERKMEKYDVRASD